MRTVIMDMLVAEASWALSAHYAQPDDQLCADDDVAYACVDVGAYIGRLAGDDPRLQTFEAHPTGTREAVRHLMHCLLPLLVDECAGQLHEDVVDQVVDRLAAWANMSVVMCGDCADAVGQLMASAE